MDVNELRELRRAADLSQRQLADLLDVPLNTFRMWDSGLRRPPAHLVTRTREILAAEARRHELLPLARLAGELGVHIRTLQAAARTGRLRTRFSARSVFGRPMRFASRDAGEQFIIRHYRCFGGQEICPAPLPTVPDDYDKRLETYGAGEASPKARWRDASAPLAKPSCISGNPGSARRRQFCGSVSSN